MKAVELLELFDGIEDRFLLEALTSRKPAEAATRKNRIVLIAAAVAAALLLAGCVAAFLGLQNRKIGEFQYTQKFDVYGNTVPVSEKTVHVVSMSGYNNSPAQQASREWNEFHGNYQPEALTNDPDNPQIPNRYEYTYQCHDQTMVDTLLAIAQKYDLKLLGERAVAQKWQNEAAYQELGLAGLLLEDAPVQADYGVVRIYPPKNFAADVLLTLTGEDAAWPEQVYCELYYLQSGYLAHQDIFSYDPETTQEWEYTTSDGTKLLLALSETQGIILAQGEERTIVILLDMAWTQGVFLEESFTLPATRAVEQLADCFDYSIAPSAVPMEGLQKKFDEMQDPDRMEEPAWLEPQYTSYAEAVNTYFWPEEFCYVFTDMDGDGTQELLIGTGNGCFERCYALRDGKVQIWLDGGPWKLYQGGVVELNVFSGETGFHQYMVVGDPDSEQGIFQEVIEYIGCRGGVWYQVDGFGGESRDISQAEAQAAMDQYIPLQLEWQPLENFPMDEKGTTFAQRIAEEEVLSGPELEKFYKENYPQYIWEDAPAWYTLKDMNGDGVLDLLLSADGEQIDVALTCRRGQLCCLGLQFFLCDGGVREQVDPYESYTEGKGMRYEFYRMQSESHSSYECLDLLFHNISTDTWARGDTETVISEEEAQQILAKYPRAALDMHPIAELGNGS